MGLDQRWRRRALDLAIVLGPGDRLIDLACGTGDLAELAAARGAHGRGPWTSPGEMLRGARRTRASTRTGLARGDAGAAARWPMPASTVVVCGFALRNFVSLPAVFREIARVLDPAGRIALLDVDRPRPGLLRAAHSLYFDRVVPRLGALLSDRAAYRYLPRSTAYLPPEPELLAALESAGFASVARTPLFLGTVQILTGVREGAS